MGGGYSAYVQHSELSRYFVTPDSELSFDLYAGDFLINLHDRFSITENTYQDPTVAGTGNYSQLQNTLGVTTLWDLNKIVRAWLRPCEHERLAGAKPAEWAVRGVFHVGGLRAEAGDHVGALRRAESLLNYTGANTLYSDATEWNIGAFYNAPVERTCALQSSAGYTVYTPTSSRNGRN